jgi:hypothetical protein
MSEKDVDSHARSEIEVISPEKAAEEGVVLEFSAENALLEKNIRRKFDMRILPIVTGIFLLAYIDRYVSSIS